MIAMNWNIQLRKKYDNQQAHQTLHTSSLSRFQSATFIAPFACLNSSDRSENTVPVGARAAARQVQQAIRTALVSGKRKLCVDILIAAIDPRSRNFDDEAAVTVYESLIKSVQPVLPAEEANIKVIVSGSTAAMRINKWTKQLQFKNISVDVLGMSIDEEPDDQMKEENEHAYIIIDPPGTGDSMLDFRKLLKKAHRTNIPVIVHNHPRKDALYNLLGYGGHIPYELTTYESVFLLAPFALQATDKTKSNSVPPRFVLMRKFPNNWNLWKYNGRNEKSLIVSTDTTEESEDTSEKYKLCAEYSRSPTDNILMKDVSANLSNRNV